MSSVSENSSAATGNVVNNEMDPLIKLNQNNVSRNETLAAENGNKENNSDIMLNEKRTPTKLSESGIDDVDGSSSVPRNIGLHLNVPDQFPRYGTDLEIGSMPDLDSIPDVNVYQHKKTLAQGMMDLALFSANANQLRYVLESFNRHPYYYPSITLIGFSLILQIAVGIGLIWNATYNVKDQKEICIANKINNFTIIGIFLVTIINVFISAFGVASPGTT